MISFPELEIAIGIISQVYSIVSFWLKQQYESTVAQASVHHYVQLISENSSFLEYLWLSCHLGFVPISTIVKSENTLLLVISMLLLYTPNVFKLFPFMLYSIFNINSVIFRYVWEDPLLSKKFSPYLTTFEENVCIASSALELLLVPVYLMNSTSGSGFAYCFILLLKLESSDNLRAIFVLYCRVSCHQMCKYLSQSQILRIKGALEVIEFLFPTQIYPIDNHKRVSKQRVASLNFENLEIVDDI
ncbi:hypothetical protein PSN45_001345 [Yamadazyma tenuis]|uniref:uncharacterized protein n=1 Tax=Candida tenuis TaxID=2315449 RepID=UPI00279B1906|nr:hypothetical protein PSN45_001345 [Yamadazyma tenuis]